MTTQRQPRYPSREQRRAAEKAVPEPTPGTVASTEDNEAASTRSRIADGKTPTTFHLWEETRYALHTAAWELGMNLSEIGEAAIRQYLEGEGISVAEPGTGRNRRPRKKPIGSPHQ